MTSFTETRENRLVGYFMNPPKKKKKIRVQLSAPLWSNCFAILFTTTLHFISFHFSFYISQLGGGTFFRCFRPNFFWRGNRDFLHGACGLSGCIVIINPFTSLQRIAVESDKHVYPHSPIYSLSFTIKFRTYSLNEKIRNPKIFYLPICFNNFFIFIFLAQLPTCVYIRGVYCVKATILEKTHSKAYLI
jgi:hypothetical protein